MKESIVEKISIPEGISCEFKSGILKCSGHGKEVQKRFNMPQSEMKIKGSEIVLECKKGNKNNYKTIKSAAAHIKNLFSGLQEKFTYHLEACSVHFPMSLKIDGNKLHITNFLGEKTARYAEIMPEVKVDIKGTQIIIASSDREAAGQTAANMEKATKVRNRDRRIYQDGLFITEKPGRKL